MNIFKDYLKSLNTKENKELIRTDKFSFNDLGRILSKDRRDYDYNGKISNPNKLYEQYKKREDVIDGIQKGLNTLQITDYENKPLKNDNVFGPKTQSTWDKFAKTELRGTTNFLQDTIRTADYNNTKTPKVERKNTIWDSPYIDKEKVNSQNYKDKAKSE